MIDVALDGSPAVTSVTTYLPAVRHRLRTLFTVVSDSSKGVSRPASAHRPPGRVFATPSHGRAAQIWPEMDSNTRHNTLPQTGADTGGETSNQNEVPTVTVAMPFMQVDMLGHSGTSTAAAQALTNRMVDGEDIPPPKPDFSAPPPYEVATKLPSYEEVQREKTLQGEPQPQIHMPGNMRPPQQPLTILAIDTEAAEGDPESGLLGTDFMFFTAFLVAFLFNWIGFLLLMCFCHTIASRYGALAGFGLSLTKWTLIVKHSTDLASRENSWLWWLIMAFGVLICVRAIIQYLNIKRGWRLLSGSAQERLLFFY